VFFIGLEDGAKIPATSIIKFGLSGIELSPAGTYKPNSGHHHLIVDAPLPDLSREIPSDLNHIHLGRGQTETELTLTLGPHTLQLLLGDHEHIPHDPPVMSKIIHVTVTAGINPKPPTSTSERTPSPSDASIYFVSPAKDAVISPNSTIRFGLRNIDLAPAGTYKPNTGHFHLMIDVKTPPLDKKLPSNPNHLDLAEGQTETKITLKPGKHTLQLIFADYRHVPHDPPVISERIGVTVRSSGKKPRPIRDSSPCQANCRRPVIKHQVQNPELSPLDFLFWFTPVPTRHGYR
jgi:hypothetical protein